MDDIEFYRTMAHRLLEENRQLEDLVDYREHHRNDIQRGSTEEAEHLRTELNNWRSQFDVAFLKLDRAEKECLHWRSQCNMARKELSEVKAELAACKNRSCQTADVVDDHGDANEIDLNKLVIDLDDGSRLVIIRETD